MTYPLATTLEAIRKHHPCEDGWKKLLAHLGKTKADNESVLIETILNSNGLDDALWCLRAIDGHDRDFRLYALWCARKVQHLMTDPRSLQALDIAEAYANGLADKRDLCAAGDAARDAAGDAAWVAAGVAARDAAGAAAWVAAGVAAGAAAWVAAGVAAGDEQAHELRRMCREGYP